MGPARHRCRGLCDGDHMVTLMDDERANIFDRAYQTLERREEQERQWELERQQREARLFEPSDPLDQWRTRAAERAERQSPRNNKTDIGPNSAAAAMVYKEFYNAQPAEPEREQMSQEDAKAWEAFVHGTVMRKTFPELARTIGDAMGELLGEKQRQIDELRERIAALEQRSSKRASGPVVRKRRGG